MIQQPPFGRSMTWVWYFSLNTGAARYTKTRVMVPKHGELKTGSLPQSFGLDFDVHDKCVAKRSL